MKISLKHSVLCLFAVASLSAPALAASPLKVTMKSISYDPKLLEVKTGQSVIWENDSYTEHSATADDGSFDTGLVQPKHKSKAIEFQRPGTFTYHCSVHGKSMSAQIHVTADQR